MNNLFLEKGLSTLLPTGLPILQHVERVISERLVAGTQCERSVAALPSRKKHSAGPAEKARPGENIVISKSRPPLADHPL